ncbi:MAG: type VI secretion system-associated protein TagF [Pseudomonadota bacterium]
MSNEDVVESSAGFYGKLPSKGDFVRRNLPPSLVEDCDSWLQQAMVASRERLGDRWLDTYLTSPIWRFVLGPDCLGSEAWCGAIMPSVDRVNRYFPLLIACPVREDVNAFRLKARNEAFFSACEELLITALDDDELDLETFTTDVAALSLLDRDDSESLVLDAGNSGSEILLADGLASEMNELLLDHVYRQRMPGCSLWWSAVDGVRQRLFLFHGMPDAAHYTTLLTGTLAAPEETHDESIS